MKSYMWLQINSYYGVLTIVMKTKTSTILANQRALLVSRNAEKNLTTIAKTKAPPFYMECIYRQYSSLFFFCVLYSISESLSLFWSYVLHKFGCLVSLISLLSLDFSSPCPKFLFRFLVSYSISRCYLTSRLFVSCVKYNHKVGLPFLGMPEIFCQRHYYDLFSNFSSFPICIWTF